MAEDFGFKPRFVSPSSPPMYPPPPSTHYPSPTPSYPSTAPPLNYPSPPSNYPPPPSNYPPPPSHYSPSYPPSTYPPGSYPAHPPSYPTPPPVPSCPPPTCPPYNPHPNPNVHRPPIYPPRPPQWQGSLVTGGHKAYYWIDWTAHRMVPPTAVHGGVDKDGSQIYVGRAYHEGDWIPAKVIPEKHIAYVAYGGGEHGKDSFQILCEQRFDWAPTSGGNIPPGAVEGGRTSDGEALYVGRVWYDGAHTVGKVQPSHGSCYIPYDMREMAFPDYEILVLRS